MANGVFGKYDMLVNKGRAWKPMAYLAARDVLGTTSHAWQHMTRAWQRMARACLNMKHLATHDVLGNT